MTGFAKIYESEKYGQILVKKDQMDDEDGAELRFYVDGERFGIGICAIAAGFPGDAGWDKADAAMADMTQEKAEGMVKGLWDQMIKLSPYEDSGAKK
jgi:hypothetical protein